jgi:hypothetical protein
MRVLFVIFMCFLTLSLHAQDYDCNDYIDVSEDRMTGNVTVSSKDIIIVSSDGGSSGFGILLMQGSGKTLIMSVTAVGGGNCIDDDASMIILFRDGSRLNLTNNGSFNCDGRFTQYFGGVFGKKSQLDQLMTKEIEAMRVNMRRGFVEEDFDENHSLSLKRTLICLSDR